MTNHELRRLTGIHTILTASLVVSSQAALVWLFDYPAIFDQPTATVLARYHQGGGWLSFAWFAFAIGALSLAPLAILYEHLLEKVATPVLRVATGLGVVAGLAYTIGIMRWVLLARLLSAKLVDPATSAPARELIAMVFQCFDVYCGNGFGETIAPLAHAAWAVLLGVFLRRAGLFPRWVAWSQIVCGAAIATRPLEYVGLAALSELSDIGNLLSALLLLGMGVALVRSTPASVAQ